MTNQYLKILMTGFFLFSNFGFAQSGVNLNNSNNQVQAGISADEQCVQTPRPENLESNEYWYDQAYHNCVSRNNTRAQQRAFVQRGRSDAQEVLNGTLKEPTNNCKQNTSSGEYDYAYSSCMQQYSAEKREYDRKAEAARLAKAAEENSKAPINQDIAKVNDTSATGSMAEIQKKNEDGNVLYKVAGVALAGYAVSEFMKAQACASQCSMMGGGCCAMAPGFAAAGAAFMLLNGKANNQADQHAASATEACKTFNQLSSAQKDCSGAATTTQTIPPVTTWYDNDGKCKKTAPPECNNIAGTGSGSTTAKIPSNCKDASGKPISCVTAGMESFKQNPDGSIKVKTPSGYKTYTITDFADKKSMMAAGLTAAQADALMDQLYGKNSILSKAGLEAKELAKDGGKKMSDFTGTGSGLGAGTNVVNLDAVKNANKKFGEKLDPSADRRPSSEGMTREFNGDLIGAAGDDIFTMMKRRYNLKAEQDTFISP
jgi:hypothetical protein